tara:strand:- start:7 stop:849 length:843 start_codon:yes stop_codon:yes gene_type:complete
MSYFKIKSHAKINLALNVVGKTNLLHKIESIICFAHFHDEMIIRKIFSKSHKIKFIGKFSKAVKSKNTIFQLLKILDQKKLLKSKYQVIIKKNIPPKSGLGGGSMNAASLLNFLVKKKVIRLKKKEMIKILDKIGSDTKLGLYSKDLILKSNNSIKTFTRKIFFHVLIVKPNFGCSTREIFSEVKKFSKPKFDNPSKHMLSLSYLKDEKNDLEPIAMSKYPKLKILKNFLEKLPRSEFARMTGSGSAIIVYFNSSKKSKEAEKKVKKKFRNYWCKTSKTI